MQFFVVVVTNAWYRQRTAQCQKIEKAKEVVSRYLCNPRPCTESMTYFFQIVNSSNISLKSSRLWYKTNKAADLTWCKFTYQLMYNTLKHQYLKNWNTVMSSLCAPSSHQWQLYFERFSVFGGSHTRAPPSHIIYTSPALDPHTPLFVPSWLQCFYT